MFKTLLIAELGSVASLITWNLWTYWPLYKSGPTTVSCHKHMPQNLIFITGIAQLNNCVHILTGQFLTTLNMAQVENTPTSKCQEGSTSIEPATPPNLTDGPATSIGKDNAMGSVKSHPFGAVPNSSPFSQMAKGTPWVGACQYPSHIHV